MIEKKSILWILLGIFLLFGLYLTSLYNYLLFHSIAELFSVVVAIGIFMLAWNSRRFMDNSYFVPGHRLSFHRRPGCAPHARLCGYGCIRRLQDESAHSVMDRRPLHGMPLPSYRPSVIWQKVESQFHHFYLCRGFNPFARIHFPLGYFPDIMWFN